MKIGLFFGSFDPVHNGHVDIARYFLEFSELDKVWLVISPQNPLKKDRVILNENHRLEMLKLAIDGMNNIEVSDIEFYLEKPNYTYYTLREFSKLYPNYEFTLIIGEDNLFSFEKWKNQHEIINDYQIFVYPRCCFEKENYIEKKREIYQNKKNIHFFTQAPIFNISSTQIRKKIIESKDIKPLVNKKVFGYIMNNNIYLE